MKMTFVYTPAISCPENLCNNKMAKNGQATHPQQSHRMQCNVGYTAHQAIEIDQKNRSEVKERQHASSVYRY